MRKTPLQRRSRLSADPAKPRKARPKKCRVCRELFQPMNSLQVVCFTLACAAEYGRRQEQKRRKRELREGRERLKTRSDWMREAQQAFNRWVVLRDRGLPCVSCDAPAAQVEKRPAHGRWNASHYRSVGACPELRFHPLNVHKACQKCNSHLSGNIVEYRVRLVKKIGGEMVGWLEAKHEPKRYRIDELREIKAKYRLLARDLEKEARPLRPGSPG